MLLLHDLSCCCGQAIRTSSNNRRLLLQVLLVQLQVLLFATLDMMHSQTA
jgi:hypothetical protein